MSAPGRRRGRNKHQQSTEENVLNAFVNLLVNVLHLERKGNVAYHLAMLAVYRSLWIYCFSTTCNQGKRNIK